MRTPNKHSIYTKGHALSYLQAIMPFFKTSYFHSVNIGTIVRFITGKKLNIWDKSLYEMECHSML